MAFENIQISTSNFCIGYSGASYFTMDSSSNTLIEKNFVGTVIFNYILSESISDVISLQFDGYYFWSFESNTTSNCTVKKWEILPNNLVIKVDQFFYSSSPGNKYESNCMAIEYYLDTLSIPAPSGSLNLTLTSAAEINIGDSIVIGPSTSPGFEGNIDKAQVINKVGTVITLSSVTGSTYNPADSVSFSRSIFIFSNDTVGGYPGVYKMSSLSGSLLSLTNGGEYHNVRASTFYGTHLLYCKENQIMWLISSTMSLFKTQAIDNLNINRSDFIDTFGIQVRSNTLFKLQNTHVYYDGGSNTWNNEIWAPQYNLNTESLISKVHFIVLKAKSPILHIVGVGVPALDNKTDIVIKILDQYKVPVNNKVVSLSSTIGSIVPTSVTTDVNGTAEAVYTTDSILGSSTITATVA